MKLLKKRLPCLVMAIITLWLAACAGAENNADGRLYIVATTTMLKDLTEQIGGDYVHAEGLMGAGVDPHSYQAQAGDVQKMQNADLVVYNGLHLEGKMGEVFRSLENQGKTSVCVGDAIPAELLMFKDEGAVDPHIWFDAGLWTLAAEYLCEKMCDADSTNSAAFRANLDEYKNRLASLDQYVSERVGELSENQRVLITAHDAFGYFGAAYGLEVRGLQGISSAAEAGTADVSRLADFIAENEIPAVFVESSLPIKYIEALREAVLSRGFEVKIGGQLYSDSLGDQASGTADYIGAFKANVDTIVNALGGDSDEHGD